jgi:predicted glycosyltransferase
MKPVALLYCQHSLGLGHFIRALTLARALVPAFQVIFINGGPIPREIALPKTIRFLHLPPLRMNADGHLVGDGDVDAILTQRRDQLLSLASTANPALLIVELYPFGRKKFAVELDPLIEKVRRSGGKIACSVRDILVNERIDQARHDDRAAQRLNRGFDTILVHADDQIFRLWDTFKPATAIAVPVHHTGFVTKPCRASPYDPDGPTLVTAGGGIVGHALYQTAVQAQRALWAERSWPMTIVAGPFFPEPDWRALNTAADGVPGLSLVRATPAMAPLLRSAGRIVSQCGYNGALEIIQNHRPVLFVPFARGQESEQTTRALQLQTLGLADHLAEAALDAETLTRRIVALAPPRAGGSLNFDGAAQSAMLLKELVA